MDASGRVCASFLEQTCISYEINQETEAEKLAIGVGD